MATKRTLLVNSVDTYGNAKQKAITNVNPESTNEQIDTFARAYVGLSKDTYDDTIRRDEESINEALSE